MRFFDCKNINNILLNSQVMWSQLILNGQCIYYSSVYCYVGIDCTLELNRNIDNVSNCILYL